MTLSNTSISGFTLFIFYTLTYPLPDAVRPAGTSVMGCPLGYAMLKSLSYQTVIIIIYYSLSFFRTIHNPFRFVHYFVIIHNFTSKESNFMQKTSNFTA